MQTFAPPALLPLDRSHSDNDLEEDLKKIAMHLFETYIRADERDINVAGAQHLGSFRLIERKVKAEGLALYRRGDEPAMRYLYRAWFARNPKRGVQFLRCYLQLLWPNAHTIDQMWQLRSVAYPTGLSKESDLGANPEVTHFLTNRIDVTLTDPDVTAAQISQVLRPMRSTLGAKFILRIAVLSLEQFFNTDGTASPLGLYNAVLPEAHVLFQGNAIL